MVLTLDLPRRRLWSIVANKFIPSRDIATKIAILLSHIFTLMEKMQCVEKSWHGRGKRVWMIGNGGKASQGNLIVSQIKCQSENQRHNESNNKYRHDSRSPSRPLREGQSPNSLSSSMLCSSSQILFPNLPKQSRGCHTEERSGYSIRTHS